MVIPEEQPTQPALPIQPEGMRVVCGHCGNTFLVGQRISAAAAATANPPQPGRSDLSEAAGVSGTVGCAAAPPPPDVRRPFLCPAY